VLLPFPLALLPPLHLILPHLRVQGAESRFEFTAPDELVPWTANKETLLLLQRLRPRAVLVRQTEEGPSGGGQDKENPCYDIATYTSEES
jgi:hypothetical protein